MSGNKTKRPAASRRRSSGGTVVGIFIGLVMGLVIAFGVAWYINRTPIPFVSGKAEGKAAEKGADKPGNGGKPGAPSSSAAGDKPRFDFYKILPGTAEPQPQKAAEAAEAAPAPEKKEETKDGKKDAKADAKPRDSYFLQVGSFQNAADADNLKAKLTLQGYDASVQQVMVPDKGNWHRVRVGPYGRAEDANAVRAQLAKSGIDAALIKHKDGQ